MQDAAADLFDHIDLFQQGSKRSRSEISCVFTQCRHLVPKTKVNVAGVVVHVQSPNPAELKPRTIVRLLDRVPAVKELVVNVLLEHGQDHPNALKMGDVFCAFNVRTKNDGEHVEVVLGAPSSFFVIPFNNNPNLYHPLLSLDEWPELAHLISVRSKLVSGDVLFAESVRSSSLSSPRPLCCYPRVLFPQDLLRCAHLAELQTHGSPPYMCCLEKVYIASPAMTKEDVEAVMVDVRGLYSVVVGGPRSTPAGVVLSQLQEGDAVEIRHAEVRVGKSQQSVEVRLTWISVVKRMEDETVVQEEEESTNVVAAASLPNPSPARNDAVVASSSSSPTKKGLPGRWKCPLCKEFNAEAVVMGRSSSPGAPWVVQCVHCCGSSSMQVCHKCNRGGMNAGAKFCGYCGMTLVVAEEVVPSVVVFANATQESPKDTEQRELPAWMLRDEVLQEDEAECQALEEQVVQQEISMLQQSPEGDVWEMISPRGYVVVSIPSVVKASPSLSSWVHGRVVVIDVETTGFSSNDRCVEVAAVELVNLRRTGRIFQAYCNIDDGQSFHPAAQRVNGITRQFLAVHGQPSVEVMQIFRDFIGENPLVGHNIAFDLRFLSAELEWAMLPGLQNNKAFCTRRHFRSAFSTIKYTKLEDCARHLELDIASKLHGALADAELTARVFMKMMSK